MQSQVKAYALMAGSERHGLVPSQHGKTGLKTFSVPTRDRLDSWRATVVNQLGFRLFRLLAPASENVLISPLSISGCLSMVAAGSTEGSGTEKELMSLLTMLVPNLAADSPVKMANSAWVRGQIRKEPWGPSEP